MADRSNIDKLLKVTPPPQPVNDPVSTEPAPTAEPIVVNPPNTPPKKPVSKMTETEKLVFAEKEQKMIEDYEMFMNGVIRYSTTAKYSGKGDVFFSPVASTVLDEFFTDGQH